MARLWDFRLGAGVNVADERVGELIDSGDYAFIAGQEIVVQDDQGKLFNVPSENAHLALRAGYSYAPTDYVERKDLERIAADSPGTAAAFGALRGLSFGLSDGALQIAGYTPEEIKAYRDLNPIATAAGEIGSLVFPFGLTSLAARGAARAASSLTARAGNKLVAENAARTFGSKLAGRAVKGAAGGAAEGAVVGSMYANSDYLLSDDQNYPLLADHVYAGAGFGAAAGGLLGALGTVLTTGAGKFKKISDEAYFRALDPRQPDWKKVTKKGTYPEAVQQLGQRIKELDKKGVLQNLNDAEELVKELDDVLLPAYGQKIDDLITKVDDAAKKSGVPVSDLRFDPDMIADRMIKEILDNPAALGRGIIKDDQMVAKQRRAARSIEAFRDKAFENMTGAQEQAARALGLGRRLSFRESEGIKRWYQRNLADYKKNPENYDYFQDMARIIREESENALDAVAGRLQKFDALPKNVKAEFIEAKEIYKSLKQIRDISAGAAARQAVNNRLPLTSYIMGGGFATSGFLAADSLLTGGLGAAATFAGTALARKYLRDNGELLLARTMGRITDYGETLNLAGKSEKAIQSTISKLTQAGAASTIKITAPTPDSPEETRKQFKKIRKDIQNFSSNPETLYARIENMLPEVDGNQSMNAEFVQIMSNAVSHLSQKLPMNPIAGKQVVFNQDDSLLPPMPDIMRFMRHVEIVNDPNRALQHLAAGSLAKEHMETMNAVFPRLYQDTVRRMMEAFMTKAPLLDLSQRASLSRYIGAPVDQALEASFIQSTQQYFQNQRQPAPSLGGKFNAPSLETDAQSAMAL